jgi:hypothetical protein
MCASGTTKRNDDPAAETTVAHDLASRLAGPGIDRLLNVPGSYCDGREYHRVDPHRRRVQGNRYPITA